MNQKLTYWIFILCGLYFALPVVATPSVEGHWERNCHLETKTQTSKHELAIFSEANVDFSQFHYLDDSCTSLGFIMSWKAEYKIQDRIGALDPIDFNLQKITLTPTSHTIAEGFNTSQFCGLDNWEVDIAKEITGKKCGDNQLGTKGFIAYNSFKLRQERLYMDFNRPGLTAESRPKQESKTFFSYLR